MVHSVRKKFRKLLARAHRAVERGDLDEAQRLYAEYVEQVPDDPGALFNLGGIPHQKLKREKDMAKVQALCAQAMEYYSRAILAPTVDSQTKAHALNNSGLLLLRLGFPEKAKISFHLALQLDPECRAARINYADVLTFEGEYDAADREFFEVISLDPNSAGAQMSRSMILLLTGDLRRGFMEYRSRFKVASFVSKMLETDKPLWNGEPLDDKTLIFQSEQGFGDVLMFVRYAELIKLAYPTCRIIYHGYGCLRSLILGARGVDDSIISDGPEPAVLPPHDYHAPLLHLPDICRTTLHTVPANVPYIEPREDWLALQLPESDKPKIGIVWAGSPIHGKDKFRSMMPEHFQRFIDAAPHCQFYALQCGPRAQEARQLTNCIDLAPQIYDWTQTANALLQLDLLISVDTAVVHLAGALGKPVWLLLASSPDWRWMLTRTDSPWYPSARLFRQQKRDDWESAIREVCAALEEFSCLEAVS